MKKLINILDSTIEKLGDGEHKKAKLVEDKKDEFERVLNTLREKEKFILDSHKKQSQETANNFDLQNQPGEY